MKLIAIIPVALLLFACANSKQLGNTIQDQVVEASCGVCNFEMTGEECQLAVKLSDKYYYVEGTTIDAHGDAHAEDGFCSTVRKAKVSGEIKHGVFVVSEFSLLPQ